MMDPKVAQFFLQRVTQKIDRAFDSKSDQFQKFPKKSRLLGLLLEENLSPRPFKIAQSGHTSAINLDKATKWESK